MIITKKLRRHQGHLRIYKPIKKFQNLRKMEDKISEIL
jgi:hypothetical protein